MRFIIVGDLSAPLDKKDVTELFSKFSTVGVKADERIMLNWRVVDTSNDNRTVCVFGGGASYDAANVFAEYCNENYVT